MLWQEQHRSSAVSAKVLSTPSRDTTLPSIGSSEHAMLGKKDQLSKPKIIFLSKMDNFSAKIMVVVASYIRDHGSEFS